MRLQDKGLSQKVTIEECKSLLEEYRNKEAEWLDMYNLSLTLSNKLKEKEIDQIFINSNKTLISSMIEAIDCIKYNFVV
jgi:hypothetical protein